MKNSSTDEPFFFPPPKQAEFWEANSKLPISNREDLEKTLLGKFPIGLLGMEMSKAIQYVRGALNGIKFTPYGGTNGMVQYAGVPFVEFSTVRKYFDSTADLTFEQCRKVMVSGIIDLLTSFRFEVEILPDDSGKNYHAGVLRKIQVGAQCNEHFEGDGCTPLHVDLLERDGTKFKGDFKLPDVISNYAHYQSSLNILLEDGGYTPDSLVVHELFYNPEQEVFFKGWKSEPRLVTGKRSVKHTPVIGQPYIFSTHQHHDVRDGHPLSNRITFGIFLIYVPALNKIFLYS